MSIKTILLHYITSHIALFVCCLWIARCSNYGHLSIFIPDSHRYALCVYVHSHRYTHVTTYSRQTDKQTEPNVFAMAHTISECMCACIRQIQTHTHTHNSSENAQNTVTISINVQYVNCNRLQLFCCLFGSIREFPTYTHNVPTFPNISLCALFAPPGSWWKFLFAFENILHIIQLNLCLIFDMDPTNTDNKLSRMCEQWKIVG